MLRTQVYSVQFWLGQNWDLDTSGIGLSSSPALLVPVDTFGGFCLLAPGVLRFGYGEGCMATWKTVKGMIIYRFWETSVPSSPAGLEGLVWSMSKERGRGSFIQVTEVQSADVMQLGVFVNKEIYTFPDTATHTHARLSPVPPPIKQLCSLRPLGCCHQGLEGAFSQGNSSTTILSTREPLISLEIL